MKQVHLHLENVVKLLECLILSEQSASDLYNFETPFRELPNFQVTLCAELRLVISILKFYFSILQLFTIRCTLCGPDKN